VDKYPKSQTASDALYWRAWASYQLGRDRRNKEYFDQALQAIDQLQESIQRRRVSPMRATCARG
jgi:TolA-binding protein